MIRMPQVVKKILEWDWFDLYTSSFIETLSDHHQNIGYFRNSPPNQEITLKISSKHQIENFAVELQVSMCNQEIGKGSWGRNRTKA